MAKSRLYILEDEELDDPILSIVNAVDVFLVIIAILFIIVMENPLNPFNEDKEVVIKNPGEKNMEMTIKDGKKMEKYKATGKIGDESGCDLPAERRLVCLCARERCRSEIADLCRPTMSHSVG